MFPCLDWKHSPKDIKLIDFGLSARLPRDECRVRGNNGLAASSLLQSHEHRV